MLMMIKAVRKTACLLIPQFIAGKIWYPMQFAKHTTEIWKRIKLFYQWRAASTMWDDWDCKEKEKNTTKNCFLNINKSRNPLKSNESQSWRQVPH